MNHPGTYIPPKHPTVFVVEIKYPIITEHGIATIHTWTCGPTAGAAITEWKRANPGIEEIQTLVVAGNRKQYYSKNLGLRERRTGHHPSIAA